MECVSLVETIVRNPRQFTLKGGVDLALTDSGLAKENRV